MPTRPNSGAESVDVLHGLCHAFGSADTLEECGRSTIQWVHLALGEELNRVRIFMPGTRIGTLDFMGGDPDVHGPRSVRARNRLRCLKDKTQVSYTDSSSDGCMVYDLPLVSRGRSLGVLEIECPREAFESQHRIIDAVVSQAAIVLRNLRFREDLAARIEALQSSVDQAVAVETAKSEQLQLGLAWTAHEFRGRLSSVQMVLDHLLETVEDDGQGSLDLMRRSHDQVRYVGGLTEVLLRGMVTVDSLKKVDTDLVEIVRSAIDENSWQLGENRVSYKGPERLILSAGPDHLRSAIGNVIRNALNYSPADTAVAVELRSLEGTVVLAIHDQGSGIPPERREAIFNPFTREGSESPEADGVGIGLFVTKQVVEAHRGRVRVTTGRGGRGSSFIIELPHESPSHNDTGESQGAQR